MPRLESAKEDVELFDSAEHALTCFAWSCGVLVPLLATMDFACVAGRAVKLPVAFEGQLLPRGITGRVGEGVLVNDPVNQIGAVSSVFFMQASNAAWPLTNAAIASCEFLPWVSPISMLL